MASTPSSLRSAGASRASTVTAPATGAVQRCTTSIGPASGRAGRNQSAPIRNSPSRALPR
ncbi:MAG: hypothetical protein ACE368_15585 [Paracoccaceae bacterium]